MDLKKERELIDRAMPKLIGGYKIAYGVEPTHEMVKLFLLGYAGCLVEKCGISEEDVFTLINSCVEDVGIESPYLNNK